jgi:hypothetical protein
LISVPGNQKLVVRFSLSDLKAGTYQFEVNGFVKLLTVKAPAPTTGAVDPPSTPAAVNPVTTPAQPATNAPATASPTTQAAPSNGGTDQGTSYQWMIYASIIVAAIMLLLFLMFKPTKPIK